MKSSIPALLALCLCAFPVMAELTPISLVRGIQPGYPEELKFVVPEGEAKVKVTVDKTGKVAEAGVESATHPAFGDAALAAIRQWEFTPAQKDGEPVAQTVVIPIVFKLSAKDRINALAGREVFVGLDELTDKVHTWGDVKKYFPPKGKRTRFMDYPEELKGSGISEEIVVMMILSPDGLVLNPELVNLQNKELAVPAIEHIVQMRFQRPKLPNGEPVYLRQKIKLVASEDPAFGRK